MNASRLAVLLASAALLGACSSDALGPKTLAAEDMTTSPYGLFLAGQGALNDGRGAEAAAYFEQARIDGDDGEGMVAERAFTAALLAGDITRAAALAPKGDGASEPGKRLGDLVQAVEAIATDKPKLALPLLAADATPFPHKSMAALLSPWVAAMAGDVDGSLIRPQVRGDKVVDYFGLLGQAYLYERAKRFDEAETDFKVLTGSETPGDMVVLAYGGFLERRGRKVDALALYAKGLAAEPRNSALQAARARASSGKDAPPPMPGLKQGAAQSIMAPAATMLAAKQDQLGLAYLRLALRLDPNLNGAWLMVGDLMQGAGDSDGARLAYGHPRPGAPEYAAARAKLAWSYQAAKDPETALKLAREAAATGDADAKVTLADLLRVNEKFAESAEVLSTVIGANPDWRLLYARGIAYDRSGRWADGERDLQAALKLKPDDSELLNYLGYSWIDRGEHLAEALAMVQKAVGENPRSGAMVDSLGWAYYRLGDYKKAVETLENAIELEAGDPDINNHLGDAYWRVGRRDEAEFQWRRVLTLEPDPKMKAEVEQKLTSGLGANGPVPPARIAGQ
ncbi:MAG TPA: tetratricopeptide repeat protein [Phenylobacterium sp.]|nr:tetratricopeptide repeat protein [Phenylobacterium sp.]